MHCISFNPHNNHMKQILLLLWYSFFRWENRLREVKWLSQGHTASLEPRFETRQPGTRVHAVGHVGLRVSSDELSKRSPGPETLSSSGKYQQVGHPKHRGKEHGLWSQTVWIWTHILLLTSCVSLNKLLNLSELQFPDLKMGLIHFYLQGRLWELK